MDLKRKLGFLPAPKPPPAPVGVPDPKPCEETAAPAKGRGIIDELRAKMADILGNPKFQAASRPPADPSETSLPFEREDTSNGPIYRRHTVLPPSHHVGRIPVDSARTSRAELLALLALDPRLAGNDFSRALFIDTVTTGLGGSGAIAFLLGMAWFDEEGRLHIEQLLLRSPGDEPAQLDVLS